MEFLIELLIFKKKDILKRILTIIFLFTAVNVHAQLLPNLGGQRAGTSAFTFLKLNNSPRQSAMGGTGIALSGDAFAGVINPANLVDVTQVSFALSSSLYYSDMNNNFISVVLPYNRYHRWAFHLQSFRSDAMEKRTVFQPFGTGEYFYTQNIAAGASYAKILSDNFSYGVNLRYVYEGIDQYYVHSGVIDVGFTYKTDFKDLRFAVLLNNFGVNTRIDGEQKSLAAFSNNTADINAYAAPTLFKMGLSMVPYKDERNAITVAAELHHPNDNSENIRLGLEYTWMRILAIRGGYRIGVKDQRTPTIGVGLRSRIGSHALQFDYAADAHDRLGLMHTLGIQYSLQKEQNR